MNLRRRPQVPTVLQMEATECGAASLAMVLATHGRYVSLETLRTACGVSRDGARASNLVRAARRYGLDAHGWRLEPDELWSRPMPAIVHWNFDHFVVVERRRRNGVQLNDPARGRRVVSLQEFDQAFTGVALTFTPSTTFERGGSPYSVITALRSRLRPAWPALVQATLAGVLLLVPGVVLASLTRFFVDSVLVTGDTSNLGALVGAVVLCAVAIAVLSLLQRRAIVRAQLKITAVSSSRFVSHLMRLPIRFFSQRLPGDLAARAQSNTELAALLLGQLTASAISAVSVLVYAILMAAYSPLLTAVALSALVADVVTLRVVSHRRSAAQEQLALAQGALRGTTVEGLQSIESLKAAGAEADLFIKWTGEAARSSEAATSLARSSATLQALPVVSAAVATAAVLYLGGREVVADQMSLGDLVAFQLLMAALLAPTQQLTRLGRVIQQAGALLRRLDDVTNNQPEPVRSSAGALAPLRGRVELRDVVFGYNPMADPLLEGLSLTVEPGARVALVGGSGSGKSTIARLLAGLETPWSGTVILDDDLPLSAASAAPSAMWTRRCSCSKEPSTTT